HAAGAAVGQRGDAAAPQAFDAIERAALAAGVVVLLPRDVVVQPQVVVVVGHERQAQAGVPAGAGHLLAAAAEAQAALPQAAIGQGQRIPSGAGFVDVVIAAAHGD